jgi:nitrite reductase/ring-hydroxylating ferredoxin subunit
MPREAFWVAPRDRAKVHASLLALAGALTVVAFVAVFVASFAWPVRPDGNPLANFDAGGASQFEVGKPVRFAKAEFWLVKQEDGSFLALHAKSPAYHNCTVPWLPNFRFPNPETGEYTPGWFRDPCSGATWDVNGKRVFGPSPRDLDRFPVEVKDGRVFVSAVEWKLIPGNPWWMR